MKKSLRKETPNFHSGLVNDTLCPGRVQGEEGVVWLSHCELRRILGSGEALRGPRCRLLCQGNTLWQLRSEICRKEQTSNFRLLRPLNCVRRRLGATGRHYGSWGDTGLSMRVDISSRRKVSRLDSTPLSSTSVG